MRGNVYRVGYYNIVIYACDQAIITNGITLYKYVLSIYVWRKRDEKNVLRQYSALVQVSAVAFTCFFPRLDVLI